MSIEELNADSFDAAVSTFGFNTDRWNQESISIALLNSTAPNRIERIVENAMKEASSEASRSFSLIDPKAVIPPHTSWNAKARTLAFETTGKDLLQGRIGGINGIGNLLEDAVKHATFLSNAAGDYKVEWIYNSSHSAPVDIALAILINYKGSSANRKLLRENWLRFHEEHVNDPDAKYMQFCHSQGAAAVKLELAASPKEIRDRIIVVALAPAAIIPKSLCFESYNYSSKRDPVPYGEIVADLVFTPLKTFQDLKDFKELILLDPHPEAPFFDHAFNSPTFAKVIAEHIEKFIKSYG